MRRPILTAMALLALVSPAHVLQADPNHPAAPPIPAALAELATLEGTWNGVHDTEKGPENLTLTLKATSGKSALVETMSPGSPHEMVSVYHADGSGLLMTHYCMLGNQPRMKMAKKDGNVFHFKFVDGANVQKKGPHMGDLKITVLDAQHFNQEWTFFDKGKAGKTEVFRYTRQSMKTGT